MTNTRGIPKVIHYCWFGGKPLPESALRCIKSWEKYCPEYEIKQWDESNYDVSSCAYIQEAYASKKWAFVSDYARFDILYAHGGVYFDTDVEMIASIDDILERGPFFGAERNLENRVSVAPGLGMAAPAELPLYAELLDIYKNLHFMKENGEIDQTTIVHHVTELLIRKGLENIQSLQNVAGVWIYPWDYFCPIMYQTGQITYTHNTRSVHHYSASWLTNEERHLHKYGGVMITYFGVRIGTWLGRLYSFPYRVKNKIRQKGLFETVGFALKKIKYRK